MSAEVNFKNSTAVFSGKVLKVDTLKIFFEDLPKDAYREMYLATIKSQKTYKGKEITDTTYVITGNGLTDCGINFLTTKEYIFYTKDLYYKIIDSIDIDTHKFHTSTKSYYYTSDCDRTSTNITGEEKEIEKLLKRKKNS
ncbi:MAG: hypothetical protein K2Q24_16120 [Chitinophagaceae bacterium]|nr:hypothetical protein [Chitinophagaceae bacterium]